MPDDDIDSYWDDLRPQPPSAFSVVEVRTSFASAQEAVALKLAVDTQTWASKQAIPPVTTEVVAYVTSRYWEYLCREIKAFSPANVLEFILSLQTIPAPQLKPFIRSLPRDLIINILESDCSVTGRGIHALLGLEMAVRDGTESDYTLTPLAGDIEVKVASRKLQPGETLAFRLSETFTLPSPAPRAKR